MDERLEIQYRVDIHRDPRWCRIRKIGEGGERDDDDDDGIIVERGERKEARISASGLAPGKRERLILMSGRR